MSERFDRYFSTTRTWPDEKRRLREILLEFPLSEELKWRKPCYVHEGANVAIIYGMKECCGLGFFKGALLDDPHGVLVAPGANSQASRQMRFRSVQEIDEKEPIVRALIANAIEVEKAGLKVEFSARHELTYPEQLVERMESDPAFRSAFEALTPGRRRGYVLFFSAAKQPKTRASRIEKHAARIREGKGLHDR